MAQDWTGPRIGGLGEGALSHTHYSVEMELVSCAGSCLNKNGLKPDLPLMGASWAQVYSFGCNDEGALGRDTSVEGSEMVPGKVELQEKVVQVSAGDSHTAALTEDGRVFLWGSFRVRPSLEDCMDVD